MYKEFGAHLLAEEQAQSTAEQKAAPAVQTAGSTPTETRNDAPHYEMFRF